MSRVLVFIASSLDGFIAGPNDEIDWLPSDAGQVEDTFSPFFGQVGAMLMGRRTFDMVETFQEWPYGTTPVLVATSQHLASPRASVRAANGTIEEVVDQAKRAAGSRDVYLDGGALIRSALDARLIDEITVTLVPIVLGQGLPLFAGATRACPLQLLGSRNIGGGLVELKYDFAEERI